jgi:hypothetical protein
MTTFYKPGPSGRGKGRNQRIRWISIKNAGKAPGFGNSKILFSYKTGNNKGAMP